MSLSTFSVFYFGHEVTIDNNLIDFDEGGSDLQAELNAGTYTLEEFGEEVKRALDAAGALTYTVSVNRTNRKLTISSTSNFTLQCNTGVGIASTAFTLMGFLTTSDKTGTNTYTSDNGSGSEYAPQFILQDHIAPENWVRAVDATVNKSADGRIEVVRFGSETFMQCNIMYITNITQDGAIIKTNGSGVANAQAFMTSIINKGPIEFMQDIDTRSTYINVILESTPDSKDGTGFKLRELYDKGLPGYFETGVLVFRVYET